MNERPPGEPLDEQLEWDQDGQYYHYLTKWMHALNRVARVTGDPTCNRWASELAKTAHSRFTWGPSGRKRLHWKMSIDLSRPLVPSMGQHDPLDGLVTYEEIQATPIGDFARAELPELRAEVDDLVEICREQNWDTADPLGIGGLLFDAGRMAQLVVEGKFKNRDLLQAALDSAERGLEAFSVRSPFGLPAEHRLGFRELGLAIGLKGLGKIHNLIKENPGIFDNFLQKRTENLLRYVPYGERMETFWSEGKNRENASWMEHLEINMVMLATSLAPEGFLAI